MITFLFLFVGNMLSELNLYYREKNKNPCGNLRLGQ
ncbi:hypothetical protein ACUY4R_001326 [Kosakonia sp. BK9b]